MSWASVAIGLGGVAVALLTLALTYRSRFSPYQQKLYERQLDAVTEVLQALGRYHDEGLTIVDGPPGALASDVDRRAAVTDAKTAFFKSYRRWSVVIPQPMTEEVTAYLRVIEQLVAMPSGPGDKDVDRPGGERLASAYAAVVGVAQRELRVKTLSDRTLSSIETMSAQTTGMSVAIDPLYIKAVAERPLFENFVDEAQKTTGSTGVEDRNRDIASARDALYVENRNLFLIHAWRPSSEPQQVVDISIRIVEHERRGAWPKAGQASIERPLTDGLIEKVEYYLGSSFRGTFVKVDPASGFRLDVSAYGPALCIARVHFNDGKPLVELSRYLDFIVADPAPDHPA